jgi:histidinol-phosphate aminotransferase
LKNIDGVRPFPSLANFIFFSCAFDSDRVYKQLVEKDIIAKNLNSTLLPDCISVTVGSRKENNAFLKALKSVVS